MLDMRSPLGSQARFERAGLVIYEDADFTLLQLAGAENVLKKAIGKLPAQVGIALHRKDSIMFRIGPKQVWVLGDAPIAAAAGLYKTPLSSGRVRLVLEGPRARDVLSSCAILDFHPDSFKPGTFAMTGIHHTPVTIHCVGENTFHIYALRTFAQNTWEWLCDAAEGLVVADA
jgi:methylglutamate dehydrogenase subunit D